MWNWFIRKGLKNYFRSTYKNRLCVAPTRYVCWLKMKFLQNSIWIIHVNFLFWKQIYHWEKSMSRNDMFDASQVIVLGKVNVWLKDSCKIDL